jgi:cytochrome o ubiquinol oxidase subunit IV
MSLFDHEHNIGDAPPGLIDAEDRTINQRIASYLIGFVIAAILTVGSFFLLGENLVWGPAIPVAIAVLAVAQIGIHLVFFLHVTTAPDNTNTVMALGFGVLIVALIIAGSIWIMGHLNQNMAPMDQIMQMQR